MIIDNDNKVYIVSITIIIEVHLMHKLLQIVTDQINMTHVVKKEG